MMKILIVGLGGFCGAVARYLAGGWIHRVLNNPWYPYGTLGVNIAGCFLIGLLGGLTENRELFSPSARLFLLVGLLGGFTTFSTFSYETLELIRDGQFLAGGANVLFQVLLGLIAVVAGYKLSAVG